MVTITVKNTRLSDDEKQELENGGFLREYDNGEYVIRLTTRKDAAEIVEWLLTGVDHCYTLKIENTK